MTNHPSKNGMAQVVGFPNAGERARELEWLKLRGEA